MPTIKQKLAAQKVVENGGNIGDAMIKAGYSPATAKTPQKLTESKGWDELMEKYLPDNELLEVHQRALHATKIHGSLTEPDREVDDIPTSLKAVELGYKVKGRMKDPDQPKADVKVLIINYGTNNNPTPVPAEGLPVANS